MHEVFTLYSIYFIDNGFKILNNNLRQFSITFIWNSFHEITAHLYSNNFFYNENEIKNK